jgi:predicted aspartyl protease
VLIKYHKFVFFETFILLTIAVGIFAEPIPFSLKRGIPEIEVIINDSVKATFAIDTGADQIYIDKTFAEKHGLLSGGKMPVRPVAGIDEKAEAFQVFIRSMEAGGVTQNVVGAIILDLSSVLKDTSAGLPDGVLGYSFLKSRRFLLSYID